MSILELARQHVLKAYTEGGESGRADWLKGQAALLVADKTGDRIWIVADEDDKARLETEDGDSVFTREETRVLCAIEDPGIRAEIMAFKQEMSGRLRR